MPRTTHAERLVGRPSYWLERLDLALGRGDLATAATAQRELAALGVDVCGLVQREVPGTVARASREPTSGDGGSDV